MSGMMNKGGRIVEQPRDLMRAQVAMRPHVLSEQWRQKNPNAASTSMPLNAYVAEWQWHTGTISAQANAEPVRVTKGFQDTATNGIAAGEILLLHAKVKDRNMMCQDVYGHRFVISLACKAPFVKLAVNLGIAPKEWSKQLPVLSRDPHPRPITSFLKRDGTLDEPIAVALASEVTNRGVAKANCIVFLSVNNDAIVVCSSQREPQHAASSPSLIALPLDADVRVCAVPPSEAHHEYDVSWGTDYDVTVGAVSDSDLRRIGHRIHSDAQLSINSRIQAATKRRPRARQQQQQQSPSGPRRASSSEDVSRRPRWSLFGGDRDGGDGGGVDGRTRGKKKNKKGARSGGDQFPLRSYPSAGQLQSGGQAGRVIALPPPSSSSSHHHHHHHHQAAPLASPSSAPMRGLPPSNTNNHWGDDDDDDDDYVRPVPLAGRYASADDLLTSDGYMAPQHLPRGEAEEVYSVANINTSGVDPFKYNKTAHAHANSSTSNSTSNSRSQRAVPPPASSRVGGGNVAAAVGGVAPPPPPASRAAVPPTLPKRTHQQQQQQQQQGGGDEEEFGFGAGTMDLNTVADWAASGAANNDDDDDNDDVLLQSLGTMQLGERMERPPPRKPEHIYGVRKDLHRK